MAEIKQTYDVYFKDLTILFAGWKKDNSWSGKSLDEITNHLEGIQKKQFASSSYRELVNMREKKGSIIYKFKGVPGHDSVAIKRGLSPSYQKYKIVPRLKLTNK